MFLTALANSNVFVDPRDVVFMHIISFSIRIRNNFKAEFKIFELCEKLRSKAVM